jgi:DNA repair exonuclease SbcCD ATPase subunit
MKITRIKLVNFIGIKHGMNLDEIEINFKDRKIVMLNGGNGSGKSTIMSQLHPFKDSFDDRKKVVIDGLDGLKEIDIEHDGSVYQISHTYGKKSQSFIKKDGVEMNENSGVRTFEEYIKNEFGLTNDYFKIGKIGSNTENFIQLTASERKTYISKFLPAIEDYLEKFNIVKEKFRIAQNDVKTVSADLEKLEEESALKVRIDALESLLKTLDEEIEKKSGEYAVLTSDIENYNNDLSKVDYAAVNLDLANKSGRKKEIDEFAPVFITKYNYQKVDTKELEEFVSTKKELLSNLAQELAVLSAQSKSKNEELVKVGNEVSKLRYSLAELKVTESVDSINEKLTKAQNTVSTLKQNSQNDISKIVETHQRDISVYLSKFEMLKNFIIKYFNNFKASVLIPTSTNIEMFMRDDFTTTLQNQMDIMRNTIETKQNAISSKRGLLAQKEADFQKFDNIYKDNNITDIEELEACRSCPLANDAFEYKELPEIIDNLNKELTQMNKDLQEYITKAEIMADVRNLYKQFTSTYEQISPRTNQVFIYFVNTYGSIVDQVKNSNLNEFTQRTTEIVDQVNNSVYALQEISKIQSEIENLNYKKHISENNEGMKAGIETNILEKEADIQAIRDSVSVIINDSVEKRKLLDSETIIYNDHKEHLEGRKERASLSTMISNLNTLIADYTNKKNSIGEKQQQLIQVEASLLDFKKRKTENNNELIRARTTLINIESLKARKDSLEADYSTLKLMKDALDPNKGIPLYFIKAYLEKTKDIANELLELAFGEDFEINFSTSDKEFFIQVRAGENIKNDIKEASQGEIAITTISISLALIEQAIGQYNILALDEIDGPLDTANRENFISILNTQIDKLGIEQVFVISHNDAFDTEEMDLILLRDSNVAQKGEEFMRNKEVIYELK